MLIPGETLLVFVPAALALNLTPGNDMLFCLSQGMRSGPRAGIAASFGIATGVFLHSCAAAVGLAALLAAHPAAFEVLRWAGVAYLVYLAVQALRGSGELVAARAAPTRASAVKAWRAAVLVSLLNPKVAVFVLAFLPQFVDLSRGSAFAQFMVLGLILNIGGTVVNALVGAFAGHIGRWLGGRPGLARIAEKLTAILLLAIAARIALERRG